MRHGSLFSGIGGFDLAAQWMGWENVFQVEWDSYCQKVLAKNFPHVKRYGDIKEFDGTKYRGLIDIISGGDPCQPHSLAGLGKGKEDDRYLWPEMFRLIQEIRPLGIVNENVYGSITNGIIDIKIADLENIGYTCQAYCIPAEAVGALHQRERIWLIAYNSNCCTGNKKSRRLHGSKEEECTLEKEQHKIYESGESVNLWFDNPYSDIERFKKQYTSAESRTITERISRYFGFGYSPFGDITRDEIKSGIIRMLNGLPEGMDYADRNQRIKGLGNAIVPQVAYQIFKAIEQVNQNI